MTTCTRVTHKEEILAPKDEEALAHIAGSQGLIFESKSAQNAQLTNTLTKMSKQGLGHLTQWTTNQHTCSQCQGLIF